MSILLSLIKDIFSRKPSSRETQALKLLSNAQSNLPISDSKQLVDVDGSLNVATSHHQAGRLERAEAAYRAILQVEPSHPETNFQLGSLLLQLNCPQDAQPYFRDALENSPLNAQYQLSLLECLVQLQAWNEAQALLLNTEKTGLAHPAIAGLKNQIQSGIEHSQHMQAAQSRFPGPIYLDWLKWLHIKLKPGAYVEIGVETGSSLQLSQAKAVGIDPSLQITFSQESWVKLFKLTSDDFFAQHNLSKVLEAEFVDMAFIDGMHTFDQALKDFINIERYAHSGTVVAFHDIFPVTAVTAARDRKSIFWLGDTWKVVLILKEMRPDLKIFTLPTYPSGLTLITGLDNRSKLLSQELTNITARWMNIETEAYLPTMDIHLNAIHNDFTEAAKMLGV